eukprot:m.95037 g.95037  ORF g.95037 m.95037 type:complete len:75 (+) comp8936_c0_seq2:39-263(+)
MNTMIVFSIFPLLPSKYPFPTSNRLNLCTTGMNPPIQQPLSTLLIINRNSKTMRHLRKENGLEPWIIDYESMHA